MKRFSAWMKVKKRLHDSPSKPPLVSQREIWWVGIGENVGSEVNGKSDFFSRPAIIMKKLSHGFYFVIPTTTQLKEGSWYVPFEYQGKQMRACLHQARAIDYRRLSTRIGRMDGDDFDAVKAAFSKLYL